MAHCSGMMQSTTSCCIRQPERALISGRSGRARGSAWRPAHNLTGLRGCRRRQAIAGLPGWSSKCASPLLCRAARGRLARAATDAGKLSSSGFPASRGTQVDRTRRACIHALLGCQGRRFSPSSRAGLRRCRRRLCQNDEGCEALRSNGPRADARDLSRNHRSDAKLDLLSRAGRSHRNHASPLRVTAGRLRPCSAFCPLLAPFLSEWGRQLVQCGCQRVDGLAAVTAGTSGVDFRCRSDDAPRVWRRPLPAALVHPRRRRCAFGMGRGRPSRSRRATERRTTATTGARGCSVAAQSAGAHCVLRKGIICVPSQPEAQDVCHRLSAMAALAATAVRRACGYSHGRCSRRPAGKGR